ncbi:MAG: hypothetical protein AB7J32_26185 [Pseudonocardia sp.]
MPGPLPRHPGRELRTALAAETPPAPGGRRLDATYVGAFTVRGGRITFQQLYYDQVGLRVQLG